MVENLEQESQQSSADAPQPEAESPESKLRVILRSINEVKIKGDKKAEISLYQEAQNIFQAITGENLIEKAQVESKSEAESEGLKIMPKGSTVTEQELNVEAENFRTEQQYFGIKRGWELISKEEKKEYGNEINVFIAKTEQKREALEKRRINISKEIFYNMMGGGYMFINLREKFSGRIQVPILLGEGAYKFISMSRKEFDNWIITMQIFFDLITEEVVKGKFNKKKSVSQKRWRERKMRKMRELLRAAIEKIEEKNRQDQEIERRVQERIEIYQKEFEPIIPKAGESAALKRLKDFEHAEKEVDKDIKKELEKITKKLSKEIEETNDEEQKVSKIIKNQEKRYKIRKKRAGYMRVVEQSEKKKEEKESLDKNLSEEMLLP